eukprot:1767047-Prorocentrum_lima.AAC.1
MPVAKHERPMPETMRSPPPCHLATAMGSGKPVRQGAGWAPALGCSGAPGAVQSDVVAGRFSFGEGARRAA